MKIKDKPEYKSKPKPLTAKPSDQLMDAISAMSDKNFGSIVVVDSKEQVKGILTERDLMNRVLAKGVDPKKVKVSDVMTTEVRVASADDNLVDWLRIMSNERFRHLPVVDEDGKLVSLMSQGDFVSYTWPDLVDRAVENTKATVGLIYQIPMIIAAMLIYAIIVQFL